MRFVRQAVVGGVTLAMFGSASGAAAQGSAPVPVAATQGRWLVDQPARAADLKEAPFGGRPALWLRNNTAAAVTVPLDLGFSDEVVVFLNGHPVYEGRNGWKSRYPGYLGFVQRGYEAIYLTLTPGRNELVLAVTDDMRFGWGFSARIAPDAPVDVMR